MERRSPQILLVDADDTLWESNTYFQNVITAAQRMIEPLGVEAGLFRERLNDTERKRIPAHGYGARKFLDSLAETLRELLPPNSLPDIEPCMRQFEEEVLNHPLEIIEGVPETLAYLSRRHLLFMVTKGTPGEQRRKIEMSNLGAFFSGIEILGEKDREAFESLLRRRRWQEDRTWMIGNSPKSDINPALAAGIHAIYIPHARTWELEHEDPRPHPRLLELRSFSELRLHF